MLGNNILDLNGTSATFPFKSLLQTICNEQAAVIDICTQNFKWKLKQTNSGPSESLTLLNDLVLYIWDNFLALSDSTNIFFISSGQSSYAICNLLDRRLVQSKVKGVIVISPTLYLPVSSNEKAEWYSSNSMVIVPARKAEGTPLTTNPSFGSCISSGSDDPLELHNIITKSSERITQFIHKRIHK